MRVLFVCNENRMRSPTAEVVFSKYDGVQAKSAGLGLLAETPVSRPLIDWADVVVVMEDAQKDMIRTEFGDSLGDTQLVSLDIPDQYAFMQPELVQLLETRVAERVRLPTP